MKQTVTQLVDDLDGTVGDEDTPVTTVTFGVSDTEGTLRLYEADLTASNAEQLRKVIAPFTGVARPVKPGARMATGKKAPRPTRDETAAIRDWARNHGFEVRERGRISADIRQAYEQATTNRT